MAKTFLAALASVACLAGGTVPAPAETVVFGITSTSFLAEALAPGRGLAR